MKRQSRDTYKFILEIPYVLQRIIVQLCGFSEAYCDSEFAYNYVVGSCWDRKPHNYMMVDEY